MTETNALNLIKQIDKFLKLENYDSQDWSFMTGYVFTKDKKEIKYDWGNDEGKDVIDVTMTSIKKEKHVIHFNVQNMNQFKGYYLVFNMFN